MPKSKDGEPFAARNRKEEEVEHLLTIRARLSCGVISRQEVPIGGPSKPNSNAETFRGAHITVANNWNKNTLSIYNGKASVHKDSGKIDASGARITVKDEKENILSVHNSEADISLSANEAIITGCALLTADGEQETVTAFNADLIADGETALLESDHIELTYNGCSMGITASSGKADNETKAKLNIGKDKNVISFDAGYIVVECGDDTKISAKHANMCINRVDGNLHLEGSDAKFRAGEAERFIPKVKNACVDIATGNVYCNGELICCAPLLGEQLRKLFKVGPKPASTLASSILTSY